MNETVSLLIAAGAVTGVYLLLSWIARQGGPASETRVRGRRCGQWRESKDAIWVESALPAHRAWTDRAGFECAAPCAAPITLVTTATSRVGAGRGPVEGIRHARVGGTETAAAAAAVAEGKPIG